MAEEITFVEQVLKRLAMFHGIAEGWGRDAALATVLGVEKNTLAAWKRRDRFQHEIVIAKAHDWGANLHWIFTGEGSMRATDPYAIPDLHTAGIVAERLTAYIKSIAPERKKLVGEGDFSLVDMRYEDTSFPSGPEPEAIETPKPPSTDARTKRTKQQPG